MSSPLADAPDTETDEQKQARLKAASVGAPAQVIAPVPPGGPVRAKYGTPFAPRADGATPGGLPAGWTSETSASNVDAGRFSTTGRTPMQLTPEEIKAGASVGAPPSPMAHGTASYVNTAGNTVQLNGAQMASPGGVRAASVAANTPRAPVSPAAPLPLFAGTAPTSSIVPPVPPSASTGQSPVMPARPEAIFGGGGTTKTGLAAPSPFMANMLDGGASPTANPQIVPPVSALAPRPVAPRPYSTITPEQQAAASKPLFDLPAFRQNGKTEFEKMSDERRKKFEADKARRLALAAS